MSLDGFAVADFINSILRSSGLDLEAVPEMGEGGLTIQIKGQDVPLLLAHNAELLDALEYIGNRVHGRAAGDEARIVFDSGSYRSQREKELKLMAEKAAEKVRITRVAFSFDPMSASERRIIHLALASDPTVRTESRGDGENRKITVHPA